jgi:glycine/sarcosine N-methyltransferase
MALYDSLAPLYDELFPPAPAIRPFLERILRDRATRASTPGSGVPSVLDVGSGSGSLVIELARAGWRATGIEPSASMAAIARERSREAGLEPPPFAELDMLGAAEALEPPSSVSGGQRFDLVLCLGNTLPHLPDPGSVERFLRDAFRLAAPGGALVLQLLNYGRPDVGPGFAFPDLAARGSIFRRRYEAAGAEDRLRFVTELETPGPPRESASDETLLLRLEPRWLTQALRRAGFSEPGLFSGWDGAPFDRLRDLYLVAVAPRGA